MLVALAGIAFLIELNCVISDISDDHRILIVRETNIMRCLHSITPKMNDLLFISIVHPQNFRGITISEDQLIGTIADNA